MWWGVCIGVYRERDFKKVAHIIMGVGKYEIPKSVGQAGTIGKS